MAKRTIPPEPRSAQAFSNRKASQFSYLRQLKVRKGYYDYQRFPKPVPWVQIKGYWLNQAGFAIDTPLTVLVQDGSILLKAETSTA